MRGAAPWGLTLARGAVLRPTAGMILDPAPEWRTSLLLAGGGLANGLIAYRLARKRPEISVRLVEGGDKLGGRHTWSFFDTDVGSVGDWNSVFVAKSWSAYEVRFPKRRRQVGNFYRSITSQRFHQVLTAELGDRVVLNTRIETLGPDWVDFAVAGGACQAQAEQARGTSAVALVHVEALEDVEARTDMSSGLAYGPLVSTSLFCVEGHLVRATFNG